MSEEDSPPPPPQDNDQDEEEDVPNHSAGQGASSKPRFKPSRSEKKFRTLGHYEAQHDDELSFNEDDILRECKHPTSYLEGFMEMTDVHGNKGLVPSNHVEACTSVPVQDVIPFRSNDSESDGDEHDEEIQVTVEELSDACEMLHIYIMINKFDQCGKKTRENGKCLIGKELVTWMVEECNTTRKVAIGSWQALLEVDFLVDVKDQNIFQDSRKALYKFTEELDKPTLSQKKESKKKYKHMLKLLKKVAGGATNRMVLHKSLKHRNDADISEIVKMIEPLKCLTEYSSVIKDVAKVVILETYIEGSTVYKKDQDADCWYVILAGSVQEINNKKKGLTFNSGQEFGKQTQSGVRISTVKAKEDICHLLRIDYSGVLEKKLAAASRERKSENLNKQLVQQLFTKLSPKTKKLLIENEYADDVNDIKNAERKDLLGIGITLPQIKRIEKFLEEVEERGQPGDKSVKKEGHSKSKQVKNVSTDDDEKKQCYSRKKGMKGAKKKGKQLSSDDEESEDYDSDEHVGKNKHKKSGKTIVKSQDIEDEDKSDSESTGESEDDVAPPSASKSARTTTKSHSPKKSKKDAYKKGKQLSSDDEDSDDFNSDVDEQVGKNKHKKSGKNIVKSQEIEDEDKSDSESSGESEDDVTPQYANNQARPTTKNVPDRQITQRDRESSKPSRTKGKSIKEETKKKCDQIEEQQQSIYASRGLIPFITRKFGFGKEPTTKKVGDFTVHTLPVNVTYRDETSKIRFCDLGSEKIAAPKTILLVGATGCGKSTMIEGMVNYIYGIVFEDEYRLSLVNLEKGEEKTSQAISQTDWITAYSIPTSSYTRTGYPLIIVDMPGFGDTRGFERDEELVKNLTKLFKNNGEGGIRSIDAICFVAKSSDIRLTPEQHYIFNSILAIFGKDIKDNIHALISFVDNPDTEPPVLDALKESKVPVEKYFTFNNAAVFPQRKSEINAAFWKMCTEGYTSFFKHLDEAKSKSLTLTIETLKERNETSNHLISLQKTIDENIIKLAVQKKREEELKNEMKVKEENEEFEKTTPEDRFERVKTNEDENVIFCTNCKHECQTDSPINNHYDIEDSIITDEDGNCEACKGHCPWDEHEVRDYTLRKTKVYMQTVSEVKKENYQRAERTIAEIEEKLAPIQRETAILQQEVEHLIAQVTNCLKRLDEIALKKNPPTKLEYLKILIKKQKDEAKDGYEDRIAVFEEMEKREKTMIGIAEKKNLASGRQNIESEV